MRKYIWTFIVAVSSLTACNDNDEEFSEQKPVEVRTSSAVTAITDRSAIVSALITGNGENFTQRGIYYAPDQGFAIAESTPHAEAASSAGPSFTATLTGLDANTRYYVRAYVVSDGETVFGNEVSFTSAEPGTTTAPILGEPQISDVNPTWAVVSCSVLDGSNSGERGVCYSTAENPTTADTQIADTETGLGAFSVKLEGLTDRTTYYVRAYASNTEGTVYSEQAVFTARFVPKEPKVIFADNTVTDIDFTKGCIAIRITDNGGEKPSEYGVYYGSAPDAINTKFTETTNMPDAGGLLTVHITGLTENTTYYLKAFATNSTGTGYSETVVRFHTAIDGGNGLKYFVLPPLRVNIDGIPTDLEFLDRNLGASRVAATINDEQSYGWMFQWGRRADGHQIVDWASSTKGSFRLGVSPNANAPTDRTTADDTPFYQKGVNTVDWILNPNQATDKDCSLNYYWAAKMEDPKYSSGGTNNPCPKGFKVPSATEWTAVSTLIGKTLAAQDAFELLAIPGTGYVKSDGTLTGAGGAGKTAKSYLWASDSGTGRNVTNNNDEKYAGYVMFTTGKAVRAMDKAAAMPVRCIRIRE